MRHIFNFSIGLLLGGAIVFPTAFVMPKALILLVAVLLAARTFARGEVKILPALEVAWFVFPIFGLAWSLYGAILGNPGAARVLSVMLIYPILFPLLAFCYKKGDDRLIFDVMRWSAGILIFLNLIYIFSSTTGFGYFVANFIQDLFEENAVVVDSDEYLKFTLPNVSSLLFLIPVLFSAIVFNYSRNKIIDFLLLCGLVLLGVVSGRRAIFISVLIAPILCYLLTWRRQKSSESHREKRLVVWLVGCLFLFSFYIAFSSFDRSEFYVRQISSILDFSENESNLERKLQLNALMAGIEKNPIFGAGAGAAASYSRSIEQPWAYELSYVALIFQYGLLGFFLYSAGVVFLTQKILSIVRQEGRGSFYYCTLVGFVSFLIANATNPYLAKFDYMWVLFIPFALVNFYLTNKRNEKN